MSCPSVRSAWVDNLRTAMIVLVVNMHACVTYSHVGDWYLNEEPEPSMALKLPFLVWQGHLQAFFMGLLFFLAGTFAHRSLQRHGPVRFVRERLLRLGVPALLYMLLIHPLIIFVLLGQPHIANRPPLGSRYGDYLVSGRVLSGNGPLWFALALLIFSGVFAGWRTLRPAPSVEGSATAPGVKSLLLVGVGLVLATFVIRLGQPIGTNVLNFQLCFFPQYVAAFAAGIAAGQHGWLEALAKSRAARKAGWLGVIGGPLLLATVIKLGGPLPDKGPNPYAGGWHVQAFGLALWEQLSGLALGLGALAWFSRRWNHNGPFARWLAEHSFAVYVLHTPVLVALTPPLRAMGGGPFLHALVLTLLGLMATFGVAAVARRIPGLRSVL